MQKQLTEFAAWYNHTYSGRVLSWRHQHTTVTLTARFPSGTKEIGVSLFQAMVLLQFNETDTLDFEEIFAHTGIGECIAVDDVNMLFLSIHSNSERGELIRTLQSLYGVKATRMLVKRPPGKDVAPTDKFTFNAGFARDRIKFKINQLQQDLSVRILWLSKLIDSH
jgi:cullin 4